ncbi:hypothetical protein G3I60_05085 [Streptomyces sp. SID13666]|uniref:hypothetical protein n=1 Tax=Streptomyces sp. SID13666 TaxID=2706054 RepID=UPI0013C1FB16|nr:hypothetical protein [Streptomyces sp. SID13666]NEA53544.1 hypothetical protein [Streptomyces sp. SID13666]
MTDVTGAPTLRRSEKALMRVLRSRSLDKPLSTKELAELTGYGVEAVRKARYRLRAFGLITFTPGGGLDATRYALVPEPADGAPTAATPGRPALYLVR